MRLGVASVLAAVLLRCEPTDAARLQPDVAVLTIVDQPALEGAQGVHDAVRVTVRRGAIARAVAVFEDAHAVVLEHDLVLVGVGLCRISSHRAEPYRRPWMPAAAL